MRDPYVESNLRKAIHVKYLDWKGEYSQGLEPSSEF